MLTDEQRKLVEDNIALIYFYFKRYNIPYDSNIAMGYISLCEAAKTYDPSRGVKFSTYAYKAIMNDYINSVRNKKKQQFINSMISLESIIAQDDNRDVLLSDVIKSPMKFDHSMITKEVINNLKDYLLKTPYNKRKIFEMYLRGETQLSIASKLKVSQAQVSRVIKDIQKKFKYKYYSDVSFDDIIKEMEEDMYGTSY